MFAHCFARTLASHTYVSAGLLLLAPHAMTPLILRRALHLTAALFGAALLASPTAAQPATGIAATGIAAAAMEAGASPAAAAGLARAMQPLVPTQQAKLAASDAAAGDAFGWSVSVSGDRALVGAWLDDHSGFADAGSAYVFVRTGTAWTQEAKLVALDAAAGSAFGFSVSLRGDRALVGAFGSSLPGAAGAGAAYVFVRSGSTWTQQAKLVALDAATGDQFGHAVSLWDDRALVGAYLDDHSSLTDAGSAYVFVYGNGIWRQETRLTAGASAEGGDTFGRAVALTADRAVVGVPFDTHSGLSAAGSAYVFTRASGPWTQEAFLTASTASPGQQFGRGVALTAAGDRLAVAAGAGGYAYVRAGTVWTQQAALGASGTLTQVALTDDRLLLGLYLSSPTGSPLFERAGPAWTQGATLVGTDSQPSDQFGRSVSLSGDDALVGAPEHDGGGLSDSGAAYVFAGVGPVAAEPAADAGVGLSPAAPNPASGRTALTLTLDAPQAVRAVLMDALGREVAVLLDGVAAGAVPLVVDAGRLAPGVYTVRVTGTASPVSRRLVVVQ